MCIRDSLLTIACGLLAGTGCGGAVWIDEEVPERFDERFDNVDDKLAALGEIETLQLEKYGKGVTNLPYLFSRYMLAVTGFPSTRRLAIKVSRSRCCFGTVAAYR